MKINKIIIKRFDDTHDPLPKTFEIDVNEHTSIDAILPHDTIFLNGILEIWYLEYINIFYNIDSSEYKIKPSTHTYNENFGDKLIKEL